MQDSQDRAPDALDRLYAEARAEVDRLRSMAHETDTDFTTPVGAYRSIAALMAEHGLDAYSITVRMGYGATEVEVSPPGTHVAPLVAWARALGVESCTVRWQEQYERAGLSFGGFYFVTINIHHIGQGVRWTVRTSPESIPHLDVPREGEHVFPVPSLEPPTRVDAAAEIELGERAAKALAGSAVA